jgi:uncharacterized Zn finger protein (UPF0148 family)
MFDRLRRVHGWILLGWILLFVSVDEVGLRAQEAAPAAAPTAPAAVEVQAPPTAVVVAVDTSRSLRRDDLANTTAKLAELLAGLPPDTPAGLLSFDDEPRWLVEVGATPATVRDRLGELQPGGNFTLLHDALFAAGRALPEGGVVLVATDGRDENSATTIEDVAHLCVERDVRILAVGSGPKLDDRALRRLALLSEGAYLGPVRSLDPGRAGADLAAARSTLEARATARRREAAAAALPSAAAVPVPTPATQAAPPATREAETTAPTTGGSWLLPLLLLLALLAAAAGVLGALLWRSRRAAEAKRWCERCGYELAPGQTTCPNCTADELEQELRAVEPAAAGTARPMRADTAIFKVPFEQAVEHTFVMQSEYVLEVREPGAEMRGYRMPTERAFTIGRDSKTNTLGVADPTLSARHFRLVPREGTLYLLDEHSTNGTFVNGEKVKVRGLRAGDTLRAGQVDFTLRLEQQRSR